ncbi:MAG: APC family permease [Coriobacteriia bacterium]|nr:APC family permease [Coriobacteriia bacterium]
MAEQQVESEQPAEKKNVLSKVLGPIHIWALGVGIVLVGEFMGWNFTIAKGGTLGAILACWIIGILFISLIMINTEIGSVIPEAGGQYAMAKYMMGPLAAFNVGLMLIFEYVMLAAADVLVVGTIVTAISPEAQPLPFILLSLLVLALLNYRGVLASLTMNFIITSIAFTTITLLLIGGLTHGLNTLVLNLNSLSNGLPFGLIGIVAAMQFGIWFYLGVEGTTLAAEETRSVHRALPVGAIVGLISLLVGATMTWFIGSALVPPDQLGASEHPLFDAALASGHAFLVVALMIGTVLACLASANGCINDSSRALFSMSRDTLMPDFFSAIHPKYKTPYRAILFLVPIAAVFGLTGLLDQVITFSIFSAVMVYILTSIIMMKFRRMYPMGSIQRGYTAPFHPMPAIVLLLLSAMTFFGLFLGYWINMAAALVFYLIASIWFVKFQYKKVDTKKLMSVGAKCWPRPEGY